jgi:hypothetical protein
MGTDKETTEMLFKKLTAERQAANAFAAAVGPAENAVSRQQLEVAKMRSRYDAAIADVASAEAAIEAGRVEAISEAEQGREFDFEPLRRALEKAKDRELSARGVLERAEARLIPLAAELEAARGKASDSAYRAEIVELEPLLEKLLDQYDRVNAMRDLFQDQPNVDLGLTRSNLYWLQNVEAKWRGRDRPQSAEDARAERLAESRAGEAARAAQRKADMETDARREREYQERLAKGAMGVPHQ